MISIREYIKDNILLFDGAMGSYFSAVHDDPMYPCELANITSPHTISEIHKRYLTAGAKAIKTNTFTLPKQGESGFSVREIIEKGYSLAKQQADTFGAYVFADINIPTTLGEEDLLPYYQEVIDMFLQQGACHFLFETCTSGDYLSELCQYLKEKNPDSFIIVSFAVGMDGFTKTGQYAQNLIDQVTPYVDAVGLNCVCGPSHMADVAKHIQTDKLFSLMPNASYPTVTGSRLQYSQNPSYYGEAVADMTQIGGDILGGCCGTTPECISQIHQKLQGLKPMEKAKVSPVTLSEKQVIKSDFFEKLKGPTKPIAVEWDSPAVPEIGEYMAKAKLLKDAGVDLITVADCPVARPRMDSSLVACKLKRELGIHAMPHMTCRDRNINAVKALLLGLSVEEINNVLLITGDPIPREQKDEIKAVYEFNSRKLMAHISQLNQSLFHSPFYLYGALNINAVNFAPQLKMAQDKIDKGCVAFFTQPVMSERGLENLKIAKETLSAPLVGGIFPATSFRNISFLTNEISGFHVAPEMSELYKDKTPEECTQLAIKISNRITQEMAPYIDGYYLITPFQRVDIMLEIIKSLPK